MRDVLLIGNALCFSIVASEFVSRGDTGAVIMLGLTALAAGLLVGSRESGEKAASDADDATDEEEGF